MPIPLGQRPHIGGGEHAPLHVNPHARIDQEAHGSRMPLSSRLPLHRPFRLSASHVAAASSGKVRYRSAMASGALCCAGPGRRRATCWRFLSITISSPSIASRSNTRRRLRAKWVAVIVFNHPPQCTKYDLIRVYHSSGWTLPSAHLFAGTLAN